MQFIIEQLRLTDDSGRSLPPEPVFNTADGTNPEAVLVGFIEADGAQIVGKVGVFRGLQVAATAKKGNSIYSLFAYPGTAARQKK